MALFALPRRLEDGRRNAYRIVRLKDKLGTRSMASGEIRLRGRDRILVGELRAGFKQMLDQVNLSRLSHGVRAAAMMRRCLNEALCVARTPHRVRPRAHRDAADAPAAAEDDGADRAGALDDACTADAMGRASRAEEGAAQLLRILTRCSSSAPAATTCAWPRARWRCAAATAISRTGSIRAWCATRRSGVLWEGTSNINALDVISRAAAKMGAHEALGAALHARLAEASRLPQQFRARLDELVDRSVAFATRVSGAEGERLARMAAGGGSTMLRRRC